jgi:hypothetical protein
MAKELVKVETTESGMQVVDLTQGLPDLSESKELPFDLMADYWTPTEKGESKRMFFDKIAIRQVKDMQTDALIELECAFFLEQTTEGGKVQVKTVSNGSKRLVGAIVANEIQRGTPLLVTYMGKKKNNSNNFQSDIWSIKPLIINI